VSKECKYGIEGLLMAIAFFIAIKILFFFSGITYQQQSETSIAPKENTITSQSSTKFPEGKALFSANCTSCHAVNKVILGPALAGVTDRVPDRRLLHEWIRDNEKVLKSKEPYFTQLYIDYNRTSMNRFPNLTDNDIDAILNYVSE
jgi:mono/diheme cytochrome c family protein